MENFFEKSTGKINKSIKTAVSKGKTIIEKKKLESEIKDIQNSIDTRFRALGEKVYEMLNKGALDEEKLRADYNEIIPLFKKRTELENAIQQIEIEFLKTKYESDVIICPKCKAYNKSDSKFCMSCGSSIKEGENMNKTCPTCGTVLIENVKFCMKCGTKIE